MIFLAVGDAHDALLHAVIKHLAGKAYGPVLHLTERQFLDEVALSYEPSRPWPEGFLRHGGRQWALNQVRGVLLRPRREWWPSPDFSMRDAEFIYHEKTAAFFACIESLTCPVVNRFGLGWWLNDVLYSDILRKSLCEAVGARPSVERPLHVALPRLVATEAPNGPEAVSVYIARGNIIAPCTEGERRVVFLRQSAEALTSWQVATGIELCRLDFDKGDTFQLCRVEPFPLFRPESWVTDVVASSVAELP